MPLAELAMLPNAGLSMDRAQSMNMDDPIEALVERLNLAVPHNIRGFRQWLMWRFEPAREAGKKPLKVPYYTNGRRREGEQGSDTDRGALVDFAGALKALKTGRYTGVGFAHVPGSSVNSIDFDNCHDSEDRHPEVMALCRQAGSYTEISPSGNGVRLLGFGDIASRKRIHPDGYNIEAFGESGFVTITGNALLAEEVTPWPPDVRATLLQWLSNDDNSAQRRRSEQLDFVRGSDPVYQTLKHARQVKREFADGRISIECPFSSTHTSGSGDSDTVYFLPQTHGYSRGHFACLHAHCAERTDADFRKALGVASPVLAFLERKANTDDGPIVPADRFAADWSPTEYILKGILQRGYLHALTGHSNAGKTAIALKMAVCIAMGQPFGGHYCARSRVVYMAGENPDDVRCRVIALCQDMRIDVAELGKQMFVLPLTFPLAQHVAVLKDEIKRLGDVGLIIVDTRAAYADAEDENDNAQAMIDARATRELTTLPGRPAVLVPNHPTHSAVAPNMRPRGGSAYYGEIDINLNVWNSSGVITLAGEKMRGAPFEPLTVALRQFTLGGYAQPDGDAIVSVVVDVTSDAEAQQLAQATESEENLLLAVIARHPKGTVRQHADAAGWVGGKNKVARLLKQLKEDKLIRGFRRAWELTEAGKRELANSRTEGFLGRDTK